MPRARISELGPNPVDVYVGNKVKARRIVLGMSQEELAAAIGLTFQQVQKYEWGTNRISVSRLVDISKALKTSVEMLVEGCMGVTKGKRLAGFSDVKQETLEPDPFMKRDALKLQRAYARISSPQMRKKLLELAESMADGETE